MAGTLGIRVHCVELSVSAEQASDEPKMKLKNWEVSSISMAPSEAISSPSHTKPHLSRLPLFPPDSLATCKMTPAEHQHSDSHYMYPKSPSLQETSNVESSNGIPAV